MIYTYKHVLHIPANRRREPTFGEENDERHEKSPGILYFRRMKCSRIPYKMIEVSKVSKLLSYTCIFFVFVDPWPSCSPGATAWASLGRHVSDHFACDFFWSNWSLGIVLTVFLRIFDFSIFLYVFLVAEVCSVRVFFVFWKMYIF